MHRFVCRTGQTARADVGCPAVSNSSRAVITRSALDPVERSSAADSSTGPEHDAQCKSRPNQPSGSLSRNRACLLAGSHCLATVWPSAIMGMAPPGTMVCGRWPSQRSA